MKKHFYSFLALFLFSCFTTLFAQNGTVVDDGFVSPALNGSMTMVDVYLPTGYDANDPDGYQVIYFLHGAGGDQDAYPFIIGIMDGLISSGTIQPTIMVKPTGNQGLYMSSFYKNSELNGNVGDLITQDLISYIDSAYNTKVDQNKRVLMGHSMGGIGSMRLAMKYPELYRAVAAHSGPHEMYQFSGSVDSLLMEYPNGAPYVFNPFGGTFSGLSFALSGAYSPNTSGAKWPYNIDYPVDGDGLLIDEVLDRWKAEAAFTYAKNVDPEELAVWFDCGTLDELGVFPYNEAYSDSLDLIGYPHHYESYVGTHSGGLNDQFPKSIIWLDSVMNSPATGLEPALTHQVKLGPNPFLDQVTLRFEMNQIAPVEVSVHGTFGREITRLLDNPAASGSQEIVWDGTGHAGKVASGLYFMRIQIGDEVIYKKVILSE